MRNAASISVALSSQLITAALTMLTVEGAYVAFVLDKRNPDNYFEIIALISAGCFILSVFLAGKAITSVRNSGFSGNWNLESGKKQFNLQAIFNAIGLVLFIVAFMLSGNDKHEIDLSPDIVSSLKLLESTLKNNTNNKAELLGEISDFELKIDHLNIKIENNRKQLNATQNQTPK